MSVLSRLLGTVSAVAAVIAISALTVPAASTTAGATHTFTGVDFGAADSTREIFITIMNASARTVSSATIGGVAATVDANESVGGTFCNAVIYANVPTGTTGTVVINFSASATNCYIAPYRVVNRPTIGAGSTDFQQTGAASGTSSNVTTVTVPVNGFILSCLAQLNTNDASISGGSMVEDDSRTVGTSRRTAAHCDIQGSSSTPTITWSWTGSAGFRHGTWAFS